MSSLASLSKVLYTPSTTPPQHISKKEAAEKSRSPLSKVDLNTPTKLTGKSLRERHLCYALKTGALSSSPLKASNTSLGKYGACEYSKKVIHYKIMNDITAGRNVTLLGYEGIDGVIHEIFTETSGKPGQSHSELIAYDKLPEEVRENPEKIKYLYTEREPCKTGSKCSRKLKLLLENKVKVFWSFNHPVKAVERRRSELGSQITQAKAGVRLGKGSQAQKQLSFG